MQSKDTSKIVEELGLCPDFKTFYSENKEYMVSGSLRSMLDSLLKTKELKKICGHKGCRAVGGVCVSDLLGSQST